MLTSVLQLSVHVPILSVWLMMMPSAMPSAWKLFPAPVRVSDSMRRS